MNKKDARKYARGVILSLIKNEIDSPTEITEDIDCDMSWDNHSKIYAEIELIYWQLVERWNSQDQHK